MSDLWTPRGKDGSGADTWTRTVMGVAYVIAKHPVNGVNLYRIEGTAKVLVSIGFKSVEGAKEYVRHHLLSTEAQE
jgi:hypothetical protein